MPWWLHRGLMVLLILAGFLAGAYAMLWLPSILKAGLGLRVGSWYVFIFVLGTFLGGALPWGVFRFLIPVKCPECQGRMKIVRMTEPPRYTRQIRRSSTIYQCQTCGVEK